MKNKINKSTNLVNFEIKKVRDLKMQKKLGLKKAFYSFIVVAMLVSVLGSFSRPNISKADQEGSPAVETDSVNGQAPQVTICHREQNANPEPYELLTLNANGAVNGHSNHTGPIWFEGIDENWGDIIPPIPSEDYPGMNWTTEGQAIWNNQCHIPKSEPQTVTVTAVKYLDGQHANTNSANGTAFPMTSTWSNTPDSGSGSYTLSPVGFDNPNPYESTTSPLAVGANFSTSETIGDIVGNSCDDGTPYVLDGYSIGDSIEDAANNKMGDSASLENITSNKVIIVWNRTCEGHDKPSLHFIKVVCPNYSSIAGNENGGALDATGGHYTEFSNYDENTQSFPSFSGEVGPGEIPRGCSRQSGFHFLLSSDQGQTNDTYTTDATDANGEVVKEISQLPNGLGDGLYNGDKVWISEITQDGYGFGAIRCYKDALNGDNLEFIEFNDTPVVDVYCIAYNVHSEVQPCVSTDIVTNGSFEDPVVNHQANWYIYSNGNVPGWSASWNGSSGTFGDVVRPNPNIELHRGVAGWLAQQGQQHTELDSDWYGPDFGPNGEPSSVTVSQTLTTVPGAVYTVSFYTSPRPGLGTDENQTEFYWNGVKQSITIVEDGSSNSSTAWTLHTYTVTATGTSTDIAFKDVGTPDDSLGAFLDNVSVNRNCDGTGHIIVHKVTNLEKTEDSFDFNTTGSGYQGFSLIPGGTNDQELAAGTYSVAEDTENLPSGWSFVSVECVSSNEQEPAIVGVPHGQEIQLEAGETVTCTFTNHFGDIEPCQEQDPSIASGIETEFRGLTETDPTTTSGLNNVASYPNGTPGAAVAASPTGFPGAWDGPQNDPNITEGGGIWVSNDAVQPTNPPGPNAGQNGAVDTWRLYSHTFYIPAGATSISPAILYFSADNEVTAYLDGNQVGFNNSFAVTASSPLVLTTGAHTLTFAVKNWAFQPENNPTGLIYNLDFTYCGEPASQGRHTLTAHITTNPGDGSGKVTTDIGGIDCLKAAQPEACFATYPDGTVVTVNAIPDAGSSFTGSWVAPGVGTCTGTTTPCTVTINADESLTAHFSLNSGGGGGCTSNCGGGGGGVGLGGGGNPGTPPGQVLGDSTTVPSTPQPQVLGATTELPRTGSSPLSLIVLFLTSALIASAFRKPQTA